MTSTMTPLSLTLLVTTLTTLTTLTALTTLTTATTIPTKATPAVLAPLDMSPDTFADHTEATVGATAPVLVTLDMSPAAFDDRYVGCARAMAAALPALNRSELRGHFGHAWALAAAEWRARVATGSPVSHVLPPAQAMALLAYTAPLPLHREFNAAVRGAGRSPRHYREHFPYKTLHFLLTEALRALRDRGGTGSTGGQRRCHRVFRGVRGVRLRARPGERVRFGHFASASLREERARGFGTDTEFQILTCQGAPIRDFSFFPSEEEVLIPPFETFNVTNVTHGDRDGDTDRVALSALGTFSKYNCEWLRGQRCGDGPCVFDTGRSVPRSPPHLGGLLLATTALAVATGTF